MWEITNEELRQIMSGDFRFFKCLDCEGQGELYFKDDEPCSKEESDYEEGCCTCKGLGGKLHLGRDL